jgi:hypothetical protein
MADTGRPQEYTDEQYQTWLEEMRPFLQQGSTIRYALDKAGLSQHKDTIYRKYKLNDWFCDRIDTYRQYTAELANDIFATIITKVSDKVKRGEVVSEDEMKNVRFFAEKHRTAQKFFVTRNETTEVDNSKVGKILDDLEETDYEYVGQQAKGQMVEANTPIQDKE